MNPNLTSEPIYSCDLDITGVTESLGVAFNSTFIALVVSILIMFLLYQLQLLQERFILALASRVARRR